MVTAIVFIDKEESVLYYRISKIIQKGVLWNHLYMKNRFIFKLWIE